MIKLASKSAINIIVYQCSYCGKKRRLIVPSSFKNKRPDTELIDFVDVHRCQNDELAAIICFIDKNCAVRSQVRIKPTHAGYEPDRDLTEKEEIEDPLALLQIPIPTKAEFIESVIQSRGFKAANIDGIEIKDRIRRKIYHFGKKGKGQTLTAVSKLGFVEIKLYLVKKVADALYKEWEDEMKKGKRGTFPYATTRKWIQTLVDGMESIIKLDETMLPFIAEYLDRHIRNVPDEKRLMELDLLLNMTISIPWTKEEKYKKLAVNIRNIFRKMSPSELNEIKMIVSNCVMNEEKTLLDIYQQMTNEVQFSEFLSLVSELILEGHLELVKLQFTEY